MDQCTHEIRAEYWKKIIHACGQRPAGQSAEYYGAAGPSAIIRFYNFLHI